MPALDKVVGSEERSGKLSDGQSLHACCAAASLQALGGGGREAALLEAKPP